MPADYSYEFINKSTTAQDIMNMSDEDIIRRYLILSPEVKKQTESETIDMWRKEFFDQAYLPHPENNDIYANPYTASLAGEPLSYIATKLKDSVVIPFAKTEGLKVNSKTLVADLEKILTDNYTSTMKSAGRPKASKFVQEVSTFLVGTLLSGVISVSTQEDDSQPLTAKDCELYGELEITD